MLQFPEPQMNSNPKQALEPSQFSVQSPKGQRSFNFDENEGEKGEGEGEEEEEEEDCKEDGEGGEEQEGYRIRMLSS